MGGELLEELETKGYKNLNGCDITVSQESTGKHIPLKSVNFSFEKLPYKDNTFDTIYSFETIEHVKNPHNLIEEIHRTVKIGGIIIMSTPNILNLYNRIAFLKNGDMYRFNENNDHWTMFPVSIFKKTFFPYFDLMETVYLKGEFPYRELSKIKLPENKLFGRSVCWIFKKK